MQGAFHGPRGRLQGLLGLGGCCRRCCRCLHVARLRNDRVFQIGRWHVGFIFSDRVVSCYCFAIKRINQLASCRLADWRTTLERSRVGTFILGKCGCGQQQYRNCELVHRFPPLIVFDHNRVKDEWVPFKHGVYVGPINPRSQPLVSNDFIGSIN